MFSHELHELHESRGRIRQIRGIRGKKVLFDDQDRAHNKQGLALASPLLAGSSARWGMATRGRPGSSPAMFGTIVTPPISWRPRRGGAFPRLAELPGGFLLTTGDHNPGYRRVLQDHDAAWRRLGVPVIVALAASTPDEWERLATLLDEESGVAGLELQLPHITHRGDARGVDQPAVRRACTLPVLVKLPTSRAVALARYLRQRLRLMRGDRQCADGGRSGCRRRVGRGAGGLAIGFRLPCTDCARSPRWIWGCRWSQRAGICRPEDAELCFAAGRSRGSGAQPVVDRSGGGGETGGGGEGTSDE